MSPTLCPSFMAQPGAWLTGRVTEERRVALLRTPLPVTQGFLDSLQARGVEPEHSFRFAGPCHQAACTRWAHGACQLIEQLCTAPLAVAGVPECGIREACRWHLQQGSKACAVCPLITRQSADTVPMTSRGAEPARL